MPPAERNLTRELLKDGHRLGTVSPDERTARSAVDATRRALEARYAKRPRRWARAVAGIAAAIVLTAGIVWLVDVAPQRASAAEQLAQAVATSQAFDGVVEIVTRRSGGSTTQPTTRSSIATSLPLEPMRTATEIRSRFSADGSWFQWMAQPDGTRDFEAFIAAGKLWYMYDEPKHELKVAEVTPDVAASFSHRAPDWRSILEHERAEAARTPAQIHTVRDGDLLRLDTADGTSLWIDEQADRVVRVRHRADGLEFVSEIHYGLPAYASIYDAGVPRDVALIDGRPAENVKAVIDRLEDRINRFGDGVAIVTQTDLDRLGRQQPWTAMELTLYAREGDRLFTARCWYANQMAGTPAYIGQRLTGWPTPSLVTVLASMQTTPPIELYVTDGKQAWQARYADTAQVTAASTSAGDRRIHSIGSRLWPTREWLGTNMPGAHVTLVMDPAHPELIGLTMDERQGVQTFWIDPHHEDRPVRWDRGVDAGGVQAYSPETTKTADGLELPVGWTLPMLGTDGKFIRLCVSRLTWMPGTRLDPKWYGDPTVTFGKR